jgi:DNA-directed RNA polymerase specialized sigma24 family protein
MVAELVQRLTMILGRATIAEAAAAPGVSVATVEQDWRLARARLASQLGGWDG